MIYTILIVLFGIQEPMTDIMKSEPNNCENSPYEKLIECNDEKCILEYQQLQNLFEKEKEEIRNIKDITVVYRKISDNFLCLRKKIIENLEKTKLEENIKYSIFNMEVEWLLAIGDTVDKVPIPKELQELGMEYRYEYLIQMCDGKCSTVWYNMAMEKLENMTYRYKNKKQIINTKISEIQTVVWADNIAFKLYFLPKI